MQGDDTDPGRPDGAGDPHPPPGAQAIAAADAAAEPWSPLDLRCARFPRNDLGNARRLIERFGRDLLFVAEVGWHAWGGSHWDRIDGERRAQMLAHDTAEAIKAEAAALADKGPADDETVKQFNERVAGHRKWASGSGNSNRLSAMLREAQPYLTRRVDEMDADIRLFNVANGTLELRAAADGGVRLRRHRREDLITRCSPVAFDPEASADTYRAFIDTILPAVPVQVFLQRWAGYSLTGETGEQALTVAYGVGANGKSTLVDVWSYVAGDYAMTLPFASLLHDDRRRGSEASPDLAQLPGARLVASSEANVGARFDEALVKTVTGGDVLRVRHLNRGFFEFKPTFKLILSCNHKPSIRGQDEGIWRRIHLVPFTVQVPAPQRDRALPAKLRAEASGILNWMLDGVRLWLEDGLCVPDEVRAATDTYRAESDPIGQFLAMATEPDPDRRVRSKDLYGAYCAWCRDNALTPINTNLFGRKLTDRGIERETVGVVFYRGLRLLPPYDSAGADGGPPADGPPPPGGEDDYL